MFLEGHSDAKHTFTTPHIVIAKERKTNGHLETLFSRFLTTE